MTIVDVYFLSLDYIRASHSLEQASACFLHIWFCALHTRMRLWPLVTHQNTRFIGCGRWGKVYCWGCTQAEPLPRCTLKEQFICDSDIPRAWIWCSVTEVVASVNKSHRIYAFIGWNWSRLFNVLQSRSQSRLHRATTIKDFVSQNHCHEEKLRLKPKDLKVEAEYHCLTLGPICGKGFQWRKYPADRRKRLRQTSRPRLLSPLKALHG